MRNALLTLSGAAVVAAVITSSCVVKETKDDSGDGGGANAATGGATAVNPAAKGGAASATVIGAKGGAAPVTTAAATGGAGSVVTNGTGGAASSTAAECPDLLATLNPGDAGVCSTSKVEATFKQINMLIVVDKSASMKSVPTGYAKSKWLGAVDSLAAALDPTEKLVQYGLMLFPKVGASNCELETGDKAINVPVGPAAQTVPAINALMADPSTTPSGGTPTAGALAAALEYYTLGSGIILSGEKYVILVTDGGPNCNQTIFKSATDAASISCQPTTCTAHMDQIAPCGTGVANCCDPVNSTPTNPYPQSLCLDDQSVLAQIGALANAGIKTFVIGIPGTEVYSAYLDQFAVAGGVPVTDPTKTKKYYEVTNEKGLTDTFKAITTSMVQSCTVPLKEAPKDTSNINVAIDCKPIPKDTSGLANWHYDPVGPSIVFENAQCTRIQTTGVNRVDVVLGCPPFVSL